jgi:hypothetical protein
MADAEVNDGAETPGVQANENRAENPGVQADENPGVQADTQEVQNEIPGVQDPTPEVQNEEHKIIFETDSEYEPSNTSYTSTSDESTDISDNSSERSNDGTMDQRINALKPSPDRDAKCVSPLIFLITTSLLGCRSPLTPTHQAFKQRSEMTRRTIAPGGN